ncbi:bacteriocin immunity protein [Pseudomonas aeruginosa]|nr:bacteriocin immunity protein [Pseudomonas aeruginosa]EMC8549302.1 bacteriocin immunity protein [Pseudomonas aeruginosa]EMC8583500.1 bacteriocin immunity protein [Pseudomonas aeruginosa]
MTDKNISDYTEAEFLAFVKNIYNADKKAFPSETAHAKAVREFVRLSGHPSGNGLLYYPDKNREDSPEGIVKEVKKWRAANGLPGFKAG